MTSGADTKLKLSVESTENTLWELNEGGDKIENITGVGKYKKYKRLVQINNVI